MATTKVTKKKSEKTEEKPKESKFTGLVMSEKSYKEWQKAFTDMEESIKDLYENQ